MKTRFANVIRWLSAMLLLMASPLTAIAQEAFDCGKVEGAGIQGWRDAQVPVEYLAPAQGWFYADAAVLALLLGTGTWLVLSGKKARWITLHLAFALLYFGIFRGGCLCPVGAVSNTSMGVLNPELLGKAELAIFLLPLLVALLFGRIFCGNVCPLGAVQHLVSRDKPWRLPSWLHKALLGIPVVLLGVTIWMAVKDHAFFACRLDVYKPVFFAGNAMLQKGLSYVSSQFAEPTLLFACATSAWVWLGAALVAGYFVPRLFCRYVCPYGVLLGLLSAVGFWRRHIREDECKFCTKCEQTCPVQAIDINRKTMTASLSAYQCVQCGKCSSVCKFGATKAE